MLGKSRAEVLEIYELIDSLETHHAYLVEREGRPVALFQRYEPEHDPIGECYPVEPGDHGIHLLIGPPEGELEPGFSGALLAVFLDYVLADRSRHRIVAEPDARNAKAIERLVRTGFEPGPEIELPGKRARLTFLTREEHQRRKGLRGGRGDQPDR